MEQPRIEHLDKRNVSLRYVKDGYKNIYYYHIMLSRMPDDDCPFAIICDSDFRRGYKKCLETINFVFRELNIPINHRLCVNTKKLTYEYFKNISSFGFEPNQ